MLSNDTSLKMYLYYSVQSTYTTVLKIIKIDLPFGKLPSAYA